MTVSVNDFSGRSHQVCFTAINGRYLKLIDLPE